MFTLKFYSTVKASGQVNHELLTVVSGHRYDVLTYEEGNHSIVIYQKTTSEESGTEFRVSNHKKDYANCYIENLSGKTISHYSAIAAPEKIKKPASIDK